MVLLAWFVKKRVLEPGVCLHARKSGRLQAKSRRQRPGKTRFSVKALRIGKRAVASYDYVVVAVHEGKLIFWRDEAAVSSRVHSVTVRCL